MEKSGVRTFLPLTTRNSGILRRGVFQGCCGVKFERRLKLVLLSGAMGVLGSLAACAGASGVPLGANIGKTEPAGSVAGQTAEACLPWDIACLLLRPVGTVPGDPPPGPEERGQDGNEGPNDPDDPVAPVAPVDPVETDDDPVDPVETDHVSPSKSGLKDGSNPGANPPGNGKGNPLGGSNNSKSQGEGGKGTGNPNNAPR